MHRDYLEIAAGGEFAAQLGHVDIHGAQAGGAVAVPELVHELGAGEGLFGVGEELVEQVELADGEGHLCAGEVGRALVGVEAQSIELYFAAAGYLGAAEERADAQQQFIEVNGLHHVVVDTGLEAPLLCGKVVPRCHEEDGDILIQFPDCAGELEAVHAGHHYVGDDEVKERAAVHGVIGLVGPGAADGLISVLPQMRADRPPQLAVILDHEYLEHRASLPSCL